MMGRASLWMAACALAACGFRPKPSSSVIDAAGDDAAAADAMRDAPGHQRCSS